VARDRAEAARGLRVLGVDPREAIEREKAANRAATEDTFQQIGVEWMKVRGAHWSEVYRHKVDAMLRHHLFPALGNTPVTQISAPRLLEMLRPIESSGKTDLAHTLKQHASAIFRFAIVTGRATADPAAALQGALAPHKQKNFPAITDPSEFGTLLRLIDVYEGEYITRAALLFTVLTFQRSGSIRDARWDQIDIAAQLWRIPAESMKMKEPHLVPLSRQAVTLLNEIRPLTENSGFVFPSLWRRNKSISENTMLYALVRLGYRGRMSVHGFRTTASTLLNENGHHPDVIEAALAHVRGDIRSIYNKAKYLPERIKLYQWWANYVDGLRLQGLPAPAACSGQNAIRNGSCAITEEDFR